jgi:hypothetical protein
MPETAESELWALEIQEKRPLILQVEVAIPFQLGDRSRGRWTKDSAFIDHSRRTAMEA